MTPQPGNDRVAVELAELRGEIWTAFAELNGRLDLALQRTEATESDISALEGRVASLERKQWPLPTIGVLAGAAGATTGALALLR
ncbi:hypothetical protein [Streptomyces atratus]|uniref:DUF3618 domain-containing protein n=1 Tax=Streptomyces atratus TaxID=1893 RepID=A0A1K1UKV8_STRAR|nr:hypothetical protein [Streptomyces atratus]SFX13415.1 hypothetical protein SAMN02787144_1001610 [Streptomyces atratus]